jgi:hypothetical protein
VRKVGGRWELNPEAENLDNLPVGYYESQLGGKKESWIRQNLGNEFVYHADGRPVHPDFSEALHVAEVEPTPGIPLVIGIDFGRTPAATIWQRQLNGAWFCVNELATVNTSAKTFGRMLRQFLASEYDGYEVRVWGDPAGDQMAQTDDFSPFDMLLAEGIECMPAPTNDFERRITALDVNLQALIHGKPAILINPRCRILIQGLAGAYQFKRLMIGGTERFHDKPVKDPTSHVVESAHYALLGEGEGDVLQHSSWGDGFEATLKEFNGNWAPPARYFE